MAGARQAMSFTNVATPESAVLTERCHSVLDEAMRSMCTASEKQHDPAIAGA